MFGLRDVLIELEKITRDLYLNPPFNQPPVTDGTNVVLYKWQRDDIDVRYNGIKIPAQFALLSPKKAHQEFIKDLNDIRLSLNDVDSPFISREIYFDDTGVRVYLWAQEHDLFTLINKRFDEYDQTKIANWSADEIKSILGQLILGVEALHLNHLAHGDLKPENLLVFKYGVRFHVKIHDFDNTVKTIPAGIANIDREIGSPEYVAPELENLYSSNKPGLVNVQACDCYSIGIIIKKLIEFTNLQEGNEEFIKQLHSLSKKLCNLDPEARPTITDIKNEIIFGETDTERTEFFKNLNRCFEHETTINNQRIRSIKGDPINLMPREISEVYHLLTSLDKEFNLLSICKNENIKSVIDKIIRIISDIIKIINNNKNIPDHYKSIAGKLITIFNILTSSRDEHYSAYFQQVIERIWLEVTGARENEGIKFFRNDTLRDVYLILLEELRHKKYNAIKIIHDFLSKYNSCPISAEQQKFCEDLQKHFSELEYIRSLGFKIAEPEYIAAPAYR